MKNKIIILAMCSAAYIKGSSPCACASTHLNPDFTVEAQINALTCRACREYRDIMEPLHHRLRQNEVRLIQLKADREEESAKIKALPVPAFYELVNAELKKQPKKSSSQIWETLVAQHPDEANEMKRMEMISRPIKDYYSQLSREVFFLNRKNENDSFSFERYKTQYEYHLNLYHAKPSSNLPKHSY